MAAAITGKTVVITGANRGIGLEFARQLIAKDNTVVAAIRTPTSELEQLKQQSGERLIVTRLDVSQAASITEWARELPQQLASRRVDVLINNAGVYGPNPGVLEVTAEDILSVFHTNTLAPLLVTQQLIKAGLMGSSDAPSLVGNVTSKMGSISDNTSGRCYPYRSSKAALNIITKSMSIDLAPLGVTCVLLHPGWVQTRMTSNSGLIDTNTCVSGLLKVLESGQPLNGRWFDYAGKEIPW